MTALLCPVVERCFARHYPLGERDQVKRMRETERDGGETESDRERVSATHIHTHTLREKERE